MENSNSNPHPSTDGENQDRKPIVTITDKSIQKLRFDSKKERSTLTLFGYRGQAKLLFSSIQFLTEFFSGELGPVVVSSAYTIIYVGAAPGLSIPILDKLFKDQIEKWILYDPQLFAGKFCKSLQDLATKEPNRFTIVKDFFTEDTARSLAGELDPDRTIIMFDQRTDDKKSSKMSEDFQLTCKTLEIIDPCAAWAKFRLPWPKSDDDVEVGVGGSIHIQPWTAQFSAESRLFISKGDIERYINGEVTKYNRRDYEQTMFGYNMTARWMKIIRPICEIKGFDRGNDSQLTLLIAKKYLEFINGQSPTNDQLTEFILQCDKDLCDMGGRHLQSFLTTPVGMMPGMNPRARIGKPKVKEAIRAEKQIQNNKKFKKKKPAFNNNNPSKCCRGCNKKFTPSNPRHNYCRTCSRNFNRKK